MSIPDPIVLLDARAKYVHPAFQMTRASTKTVFDATGKLVTVPANALGWDHYPATGQARGYLAEPSATNLILYSNDLSNGAWSLNNSPTITPNAIVGPDGGGIARVERTASGATSVFQVPTIVAGEPVCGSLIAKAGEITAIEVRVGPGSGHMRYAVSLIDGSTVLPPTTGGSNASEVEIVDYGVEDLGDGFWRPWIAGTLASGTTSATTHALLWVGGVGDGVYVGYVQAEPGTHPTSYIETGGATATRAGDSLVLSDLGDFPWWRSERGTLLLDAYADWPRAAGEFVSVGESDLSVRWSASGAIFVPSGGLLASSIVMVSAGSGAGRHRLAVTWDGSTVVAAASGVIAGSSAVQSALSDGPAIGLGCRSNGVNAAGAHIVRATYYPARLSNADLQSLTAIQE